VTIGSIPPAMLALAAAAIVFAGLLRGFTGFGFALAAVPLASLVLPPSRVVPVVLLMQAAIGLRDCIREWRNADGRAVAWLSVGSVAGTPLGLLALAVLPQSGVRLALGAIVAAAVAATWRAPRPQGGGGRSVAMLSGLCSGVCNGLAAMSGPPAIIHFLLFEPDRSVTRSSLLVFFPVSAALALVPAAASGLVDRLSLALALLGMPLMIAGGWVGTWGFRRAGARHYRMVAASALLVTAIASIARGLAGLLP
jgi:uncharacterized protein